MGDGVTRWSSSTILRLAQGFGQRWRQLVRCAAGCFLRFGLPALVLGIALQLGDVRASAAAQCYVATSASSHALCWLDLTNYTPTSGVSSPQTFTLPDGSTLALTISTTITPTSGTVVIYKIPTDNLYALGSTSSGTGYLGVSGKPVIYAGGAEPVTTTLSGITLTDPTGKSLSSVKMAGADAEETNASDESIGWSTAGAALADLQLMLSVNGTTTPVCTLSLGTSSANCAANSGTVGNSVAGYILSSVVTPAQNFGMTATSAEHEGYAFAIDIAELSASATINGRSNASDEFTVQILRSSTTLASGSTTGTGTSVSAAPLSSPTSPPLGVFPTDTYTISETAASGNLSNYVTTYACTNAVSSSTTLPAGTGTSISITPAVDDQISCAFTSDGLTLTNTAPAAQTVATPATVTDTFTLTNTSAIAGTFSIGTIAVSGSSSGSITPSGYVFGGTTYTTLSAAQSAINSAGATAANGSITFGVKFSAPGTAQTISTTLAATITSGSSASPAVSATASGDMLAPTVAVAKSNNGPWTIGQSGASYTITPSNSGNGATSTTITVTDTLPTGLTLSAVPSGTGWTCTGAVGASSLSCTSTTAIAAGGYGNAITVPVTIGTSTPVGTNSISNTAKIYGGDDSVHTSAGTAATSTANTTTISGVPTVAVAKSNNGAWTIAQSGAQYTITPSNSGTGATTATITVTDTLPTGLTLSAVPSGTGWTCSGAVGASSLSCTSSTAIAAGANGNAITVPVTIGTSTPIGTISNTASIYGGGDSVHTNSANAATSAANTTTVGAQLVPSITLTLSASQTTPSPGSDVTYTDAFANVGTAAALNIVITMPVPSGTCFKVGSVTSSLGTTGLTAAIGYSSNGGVSYAYGPVSGACGSATSGYDAAVTHVRWTLSGTLSASSPNNSGSLSITTHIP